MATIGQALTAPEPSWSRYDDRDIRFTYVGTGWAKQDYPGHWLNTMTGSATKGDKIKFQFYGTKIRAIIDMFTNNDELTRITIDGKTDVFTSRSPSGEIFQALAYEKLNLSLGLHVVEIECGSSGYLRFDAIDIDDTGRLLHANEVMSEKDLVEGKRIRANYVATANAFGTISGLGKETKSFLPAIPTATPNGDFYFIMVGTDFKGRAILIPDRNIQNGISWDVLNTAGVASGSGLQIPLVTSITYVCTLRLLTGGLSSADKDNEWDRYIVNGTGNGAYPAGSNEVWNFNATAASMTSTTVPNTGGANRVWRGYNSVSQWNNTVSSTVDPTIGFRPVLLIENVDAMRYLVQDGSDIKVYDVDQGWIVVGTAPVSEDLILTKGMIDLQPCISHLFELTNLSSIQILSARQDPTEAIGTLAMVPKPQVTKMKNDMDFQNALNIDSITITGVQSGQGVVRVAVSADKGLTWKIRQSNGTWTEIDINDKDAFKANGMTITAFNAIRDWMPQMDQDKKIRLAFYLEQQAITDTANIDQLAFQIDMMGTWNMGIPGTDYRYGYNSNTNLKVTLLTSGDFKINYVG